jgi:hypothetical protein
MADPTAKELLNLANSRTDAVEGIVSALAEMTSEQERNLSRRLVDDVLGELEFDNKGKLVNSARNIAKLDRLLEKVMEEHRKKETKALLTFILASMGAITAFNIDYFGNFTTKKQAKAMVQAADPYVNAWLGIDNKGKLKEGGYLDTLNTDKTVRNTLRDMMLRGLATGETLARLRKGVRGYIEGGQGLPGALQKRNDEFVNDVFSKVDRYQANTVAEKLDMNYAVYEGGLIKTSRKFCRERNGKVFTRAEILKFDPPTAKPPNYDPLTDLGGYNCRHHLNWIPYTLAVALRPDLRRTPELN